MLLNRQIVPVLASGHHARVHFLAATYRGHGHAFRVCLHEVVVHHCVSIGYAGHPARGLRGLLSRFSSINIQIPLSFDSNLLVLHCLFLALLNRADALAAHGRTGRGTRILLPHFALVPLMPCQILLLRLHKCSAALGYSLLARLLFALLVLGGNCSGRPLLLRQSDHPCRPLLAKWWSRPVLQRDIIAREILKLLLAAYTLPVPEIELLCLTLT